MFLNTPAAEKVAHGVKWAAAAAVLILAGCGAPGATSGGGAEQPPRPLQRDPVQLAQVLDSVYYNSSLWRSLSADCRVEVRAPGLINKDARDEASRNTVVFDKGKLYMFKRRAALAGVEGTVSMNMLHVSAGEDGKDLYMVSDGTNYYVSMLRLGQEYSGKVREMPDLGLRSGSRMIVPVLPQDIADLLEPAGALWEYAPVLKQDQEVVELLLLEFIEGRRAAAPTGDPGRIRLAENLLMSRKTFEPSGLIINGPNDAPRGLVRYMEFSEVDSVTAKGTEASGKRGRVPSKFWIGYPDAGASIQFTLTNIKIDEKNLNPGLFRLEQATR